MSSVRLRKFIFICSAISENNELISKEVEASSKEEASNIFLELNLIRSQITYGPFKNKKRNIVENTKVLKFSAQIKKAIYNGWIVNAFILVEPIDYAYLVFIKRIDDKKINIPKGTITVPITDLRFIENE